MQTVIAVITSTAYEPQPRFLADTLKGLDETGADEVATKLVYCDGPWTSVSPISGIGRPWPVVATQSKPSGSVGGVLGLFRRFLTGYPKADQLLFFEDDIAPCRNAVRRMLATKVPEDAALVTFCDLVNWKSRPATPALVTIALGPAAGNPWVPSIAGHQACLIPRKNIERLVSVADRHPLPASTTDSDYALSQLAIRANIPRFALHVPSLVQHIGGSFSRALGREVEVDRSASHFPGESFDALTLP